MGQGGLSISINGNVIGQDGHGINAYNSANDVMSSTVIYQAAGTTITGASDGIHAENHAGSLTITALGVVTGQTDDGIYANNAGGSGTLTITTGSGAITGTGGTGIEAWAGRSLVMDINGAVTGGADYGIRTVTGAGHMTVITLHAGVAVSATSGLAIRNNVGDSTIQALYGSSISGEIHLEGGSDNLYFRTGSDFTGVTVLTAVTISARATATSMPCISMA